MSEKLQIIAFSCKGSPSESLVTVNVDRQNQIEICNSERMFDSIYGDEMVLVPLYCELLGLKMTCKSEVP